MTVRPSIVILSAYYFPFQGGVETHARALAVYLRAHDFPVTVVTKQVDGVSTAADTVDSIPVHRVWPPGARTGFRKWLMIPFAFRAVMKLGAACDLVYCPGYQGIGIAAILAARRLRRPVILRSGNIGVLMGTNWNAPLARAHVSPGLWPVAWLKQRLRRFYMTADGFVCNSRDIEREALECGVPRDQVHYLPNAVDVARFRPAQADEQARIKAQEGWAGRGLVCLYVGRLSLEKGVLDLLDAWRQIGGQDHILVLVGPDMTGNPLDVGARARTYVSDHGMTGRVIFYGESTDVARLLRGADVYVQPSHYEAFSNSVIEAMATGLPMVASRVGGMLDCVVDEDNGLLAAPASPGDLARALTRLLNDPHLRSRLGQRARESTVEHFDQEKIFARQADLFAQTAR